MNDIDDLKGFKSINYQYDCEKKKKRYIAKKATFLDICPNQNQQLMVQNTNTHITKKRNFQVCLFNMVRNNKNSIQRDQMFTN